MDSDLLKALLAMDAYNRGYNEGVKGLGSVGSKIGTATIITDSLQTPSTSNSISVGFYGLAYKLTSGETIISYRGTDVPASWFWSDAPGSDIWYGWTTGAGSPSSEQAELAIKFYQSVAGTGTDPRTANISLTGHSLGGGLAGFIGDLYHKTGVLFDNMAFELAADKTYAYATVINTLIPDLKNLVYGTATPWDTSIYGLKSIYVDGEVLAIDRVFQDTPQSKINLAADNSLSSVDKHSMSLLTIMLYADRSITSTQWQPAGKFLLSALYNQSAGLAAGADSIPATSASLVAHDYANITRTAIAYSAIDGNEVGAVTVFGDTGIRALFNDATDLGKTLGFATSTTLKNSAQSISDMFVQFAGQLALGKVLQSSSPTVTNGIVTLSPDNATLSIDLSQNLWANGKVAAGASDKIVGREELIDSVFSQSNTTDIRTGMKWLWNEDIIAANDNAIIWRKVA